MDDRTTDCEIAQPKYSPNVARLFLRILLGGMIGGLVGAVAGVVVTVLFVLCVVYLLSDPHNPGSGIAPLAGVFFVPFMLILGVIRGARIAARTGSED